MSEAAERRSEDARLGRMEVMLTDVVKTTSSTEARVANLEKGITRAHERIDALHTSMGSTVEAPAAPAAAAVSHTPLANIERAAWGLVASLAAAWEGIKTWLDNS